MEYPNSHVSRYCTAQPPVRSLLSNYGGIPDILGKLVMHLVTTMQLGVSSV